MTLQVDLNIYLILIVNSIISGVAGGFGGWTYNKFLKKHADKVHRRFRK